MPRRVSLSRADLDEMEQVAAAASQEPWQFGHSGTETHEAAVQFATDTITKSDLTDLWMAFTGDPNVEGDTKVVALTGNGPMSEANAAYLVTFQPRNMLNLLWLLRKQMDDGRSIWTEAV